MRLNRSTIALVAAAAFAAPALAQTPAGGAVAPASS